MPQPSVIVVNSLVARGSVGARASVFALERLGFPVIVVPTVVLTWHPGHGPATRLQPDAATFAGLVGDIAGAPWFATVGAVLTGYLGDVAQVAPTAALIAALKAANPRAVYLCDPNIGDAGNLFRPEAVAVAIRDRLLPLADIVTPNRFEFDWLTAEGADLAAEVVITSAATAADTIETWVSTAGDRFRVSHRWLPDNLVHGTGDLFAALYLGHRLAGATPREAAARATGAVSGLIAAANDDGLDEIPLAAGQAAFADGAAGVSVTTMTEG